MGHLAAALFTNFVFFGKKNHPVSPALSLVATPTRGHTATAPPPPLLFNECDMEQLGARESSEKTIAILEDRWWPQAAK